MEINVTTRIPYPIDQVYTAMRHKLPDLAAYMPNVDSIVVEKEDTSTEGVVKLLNRWNAARTEVPTVARPFVDQSRMFWHDDATWYDKDYRCEWILTTGFMSERVDCKGTTSYHAAGDHTEMRIRGTMLLNLKGLVPRLVLKKATAGVERFVGKLIEPNFQKTADALTAYLDAQKGA